MFRGWKPSTSFSGSMANKTASSSICFGKGNWIEDFLYYILFSIEQLNINTECVPLYIIGETEPTALFYRKVRMYVKYIYLLKYHKEHFAKGMDEDLIRRNFILTQSF